MNKRPFAALLVALTPFAAAGALATRSTAIRADGLCEDGSIPVVWPLGATGFEPQRLLDSHGQFLQFGSDLAYVHEGIDIAACVGDEVYAVEDGTVDYVSDDGGKGWGYILVRDTDEPTLGWKYMHLTDIAVDTGAKKQVLRDQFLGRVVEFPDATGFDHLHLERMAVKSGASKLDLTSKNGGDPLPLLAARADASPPRRLPFGAPHPTAAGFLFYEISSGTLLGPGDLSGREVEIVARVSEMFPGVGAPACAASSSACSGTSVPMEVTPRRISLGIFHQLEDPSGTIFPRTRLEKVFHNVIDLTIPVRDIADPSWSSTTLEDAEAFAAHVYHEDSQGDYAERNFLVKLTRCPIDGSGTFEFDESGEYLLQLVLEDSSGNVDRFERVIDVP